MIIKNNLIPVKGFTAMSIFPFIFVRKDWVDELNKLNGPNVSDIKYERTLNHERIHAAQQLEVSVFGLALAIVLSILLSFSWWMLLIPILLYYVMYVLDWLFGVVSGSKSPYKEIIFEKEAYANGYNTEYLKDRKPFSFLRYF